MNPFAAPPQAVLVAVRTFDGSLFWLASHAADADLSIQREVVKVFGEPQRVGPATATITVKMHGFTGEWRKGPPDIRELERGQAILPEGERTPGA